MRFLDPDRQAVAEFCMAEGVGRIAEHSEPMPPPLRWKTEKPHRPATVFDKVCGGRGLINLIEVAYTAATTTTDGEIVEGTSRAFRGTCTKCRRLRLVFTLPKLATR